MSSLLSFLQHRFTYFSLESSVLDIEIDEVEDDPLEVMEVEDSIEEDDHIVNKDQDFVKEGKLALVILLAGHNLGILEVRDREFLLGLHLVLKRRSHRVIIDVVERRNDSQGDVVHHNFFDVRRVGDDGKTCNFLIDLHQEFHEADDERHRELMEVFWMTTQVMDSFQRCSNMWLESEMQHERTQNSDR